MTGFGATATRLGARMWGFSATVRVRTRSFNVASGFVPIIADGTGYGGLNNIRRTVDEYIQACGCYPSRGQVAPKRCGQRAALS